jgi:hypothetical protein
MVKYILANIRWGDLSSVQIDKLNKLSLGQVIKCPYLDPKLQKNH